MRPGSRFVGSVVLLVAGGISAPALADTEIQATVVTSAGWTDNATGEADDGTGGDSTQSAFTSLQPGVTFLWESTKSVQRLAYTLGINVFLTEGAASSFSNALSYDISHSFTEFTDGLFSLNATHVKSNTAILGASASEGTVTALPSGQSQFLGFGAGGGLTHQISPVWRTNEGVNASYTTPVSEDGFGDGKSFTGQATLGLDRDLDNGSIGFGVIGTYVFIEQLAGAVMPGGMAGDQEQYLANASARYTRPIGELWGLDLTAGATGAALADDAGDAGEWDIYPTGSAALGWQSEEHSAALAYTRGVSLNPYLLQTIVADDFVARGTVPLGRSRWIIGGSLGYQHGKTLFGDAAGMDDTTLDVFSVDAAVGYEISPTMNLGGRYQFARQESSGGAVPDLTRNSLSVVFTIIYPDKTRTVMPYKQPMRMLRSPTLGDEPARPGSRGGI
jgi:hypothetical protein